MPSSEKPSRVLSRLRIAPAGPRIRRRRPPFQGFGAYQEEWRLLVKAFALLALGCAAPALLLGRPQAAPPEPAVEQVIAALQADLAALESALPDFSCEEKVVSEELRGTAVRHKTVNESHFVARRNSRDGQVVSFTEIRTLHTVDSKPVPPGRKLKGPIVFRNAFVNVLHATVSPEWAPRYEFRLAGRESLGGKPALVVAYTARAGQQSTGITLGTKFVHSQITGKMWLDAASLHILRMSWVYPDLPKPFVISASVDYAPVNIGGAPFWMPTVVKVESPEKNPKHPAERKNRTFSAEYSAYRKFDVNSTITFEK
jgi:hypothetical protein